MQRCCASVYFMVGCYEGLYHKMLIKIKIRKAWKYMCEKMFIYFELWEEKSLMYMTMYCDMYESCSVFDYGTRSDNI